MLYRGGSNINSLDQKRKERRTQQENDNQIKNNEFQIGVCTWPAVYKSFRCGLLMLLTKKKKERMK